MQSNLMESSLEPPALNNILLSFYFFTFEKYFVKLELFLEGI